MNKIGRNDPCPCGSGKKYKQCCMREASAAAPAVPSAQLLQLAFAQHMSGNLDEAQAVYRDIVRKEPGNADAWHLLGVAAGDRGDRAKAIEYIGKAIAIEPGNHSFHANLGRMFTFEARYAEAESCYRRALALKADAAHYEGLGTALREQGRFADAEAGYRRAIAFNPGHASAHRNLGDLLQLQQRHSEAIACYRQALALQPDLAEVHRNLGIELQAEGDFAAAIDCFQRALALAPDTPWARDNLLYACSIHCTPRDYLQAARRHGETLLMRARGNPALALPDTTDASDRPGGPPAEQPPLRIGFVSGDLRIHPVGIFLESVLAQLRNSRSLELFAYPTVAQTDALTERIKPCFAAWRPLAGVDDTQAARLIRADRIDILVDLSGYTADNRLPLFAARPAPVQVSWLGYWASTGLATIDYVLADRHSLPPSEAADYCERPWYLPDTRLCFTPPREPCEVAPPPVVASGCITFGCFNNPAKINDAVVALWSQILRRAGDTRLLLKARQFADAALGARMQARFAAHGVDPARILLQPESKGADYFAAYAAVDIALDPFPFTGGTTSVDGLWMGVPFVTLRGDRMIAHQGEGILHNVGLADWIAADAADYVEIALRQAAAPQQLSALRSALRTRLLDSPLCDAPRFAANLQDAFAGMWREHLRAATGGASAG